MNPHTDKSTFKQIKEHVPQKHSAIATMTKNPTEKKHVYQVMKTRYALVMD